MFGDDGEKILERIGEAKFSIFVETERISTYLFAIVVGPFEYYESVSNE